MIFIENKYTKIYFNIVNNAQSREPIVGYVEKHHIIPKSLGGSNNKENLVKLTAREHFICHWLLTKMVGDNELIKMKYALWRMMVSGNEYQSRYSPCSHTYELLRKNYGSLRKGAIVSCQTRENISLAKKGKLVGDNNPMYGKTHTDEARKKIGDARIGKQPWNKGITHSDETKAKIAEAGQNRAPISEETRLKMVIATQNRDPISEETRIKMSISAKKRVFKLVICEHCGLTGKGGNMSRWHGDNCKMKPK